MVLQEILNEISNYGYILLFLYSLGGGFVGLVAAAVLSYMGKLDIWVSILVAGSANFLGDEMLFYMAKYYKKEMMRYIRKHRRKIALSHLLMKKYGSIIILFQKFVYGIKTAIPLAIGLTKYDGSRFFIYNLLSAYVWALSVGMLAFSLGEVIVRGVDYISNNSYIMPIIGALFFSLIWLYLSRMSRR